MAPVVRVGTIGTGVGAVGTIVFGIWLAFSLGGYRIWDGWIIAAIVLWAIAGGPAGGRGTAYMEAMTNAQELVAAGQTGPNAELAELEAHPDGPAAAHGRRPSRSC